MSDETKAAPSLATDPVPNQPIVVKGEPSATGATLKEWHGESYVYQTGDWSYEELKAHKRELLAEKKLVWGALGFEKTWMTTAQEVADRALALRHHWFKRLWMRWFP